MLSLRFDIADRGEKEQTMSTFTEDILYNLPGFIYWKNKNSQYIGFNKNVVLLSRLSKDELLGKTDLELSWGKKEAETFQKDDQEVMETGIVKVTEHEIPIKHSENQNIILRTEKSRLYDREGNIIGVLAVAMDITDQKILEQKLMEEKERVERMIRQKTEFIRNMEHDIRTPFCGVYSITKLLEEKETDTEKKILLTAIAQSAKELLDYCNGILDFSKIESGTTPIVSKKFDLKTLIDRVVNMEKPAAMNKNILILVEYPTTIPTVFKGDPYRIQRILVNLISNAIKFTQKGYVKVRVQFVEQNRKKLTFIRFYIQDTGIGIPQEQQMAIYERFHRLNPSNQGKYKGLGLGLSIVKHLAHELNGEIDVKSEMDKGTIFVCTIPLPRPLVDEILFEEDNG